MKILSTALISTLFAFTAFQTANASVCPDSDCPDISKFKGNKFVTAHKVGLTPNTYVAKQAPNDCGFKDILWTFEIGNIHFTLGGDHKQQAMTVASIVLPHVGQKETNKPELKDSFECVCTYHLGHFERFVNYTAVAVTPAKHSG